MLRKRITAKLQNYILVKTIQMLNVIFGGTLKSPPSEQIKDFKQSGLFGRNKQLEISKLYLRMSEADFLDANGLYFKSTSIRREALEYVYNHNNIDLFNWQPKWVSYGFGQAIGHRALLGLILAAQELNIISSTKRTLIVDSTYANKQLRNLFFSQKDLEIVYSMYGSRSFESPAFWHLSERVKVIKTRDGFISDIELTELVNSKRIELNAGPFLNLEFEYTSSAENMLSELGLPPKSQFIAIHIRNKSKFNLDDTRRADVKSFEMVVAELIKMGYWVVQFGTDQQSLVLNNPKVIKISSSESRTTYLTPYLIAFAKIFINTCSGPTHLAPLFNTPVLQTNVISLGKNTCSLTDRSIHLPKKWKMNNRYLSLYELLNSPEGYSDSGIRNLNKKGIELIENTPSEIYEAVLDILNCVNHGKVLKNNIQIDDIRTSCNSPVRGNFAPSFVQANESWFLN